MGHRRGSDLTWLWLWCRPVTAALICPLAWEYPYAPDTGCTNLEERKERRREERRGGGRGARFNIGYIPILESPLWLSGLRVQHIVREEAGLIPSVAQWVKDLALP